MPRLRYSRFRTFSTSALTSVALCICALATPIQAQTAATEPNLRAAIVYRLLQASSWPGLNNEQVQVCEFGNGKNAAALQLLNKLKLGTKRQINVGTAPKDQLKDCQVLIIGPEQEQAIPEDLAKLFVICNACDKNKEFSAIDLFLHQDQVRYDINLAVAERVGIHFSSDALRYALAVRKK